MKIIQITVEAIMKNTNDGNNNGETNQGTLNNVGNTSKGKEDSTTATGTLPKTGVGVGLTTLIIFILGIGIFTFSKYKWYRDIE